MSVRYVPNAAEARQMAASKVVEIKMDRGDLAALWRTLDDLRGRAQRQEHDAKAALELLSGMSDQLQLLRMQLD
jgi:hypothetical protein